MNGYLILVWSTSAKRKIWVQFSFYSLFYYSEAPSGQRLAVLKTVKRVKACKGWTPLASANKSKATVGCVAADCKSAHLETSVVRFHLQLEFSKISFT
jgi:hypothetical protein